MSLSAATPRAPNLSGSALDGRYELHALIGEGAFGRVYRGRDRRLAREVAVKVIKPWWAEDPEWARSFEREAQLMASVNDLRIVQIFDVGQADEGLYYVAELVEGESIATRLRRGPLVPSDARDVAEQLCRALASAHAQRVVHGDVKPANLLISSTGRVKVTDFGLARLLGGTSGHVEATIVGTPSYMAPEQGRSGVTTPATDVYSAGVVLYEMLAGAPPFSGGSPVELALKHLQDPPPALPSGTPAALAAIVERALAKDPEMRYRHGGQMADALARTRVAARRRSSTAETAVNGRAAPSPETAVKGRARTTTGSERTLVAPGRNPRRNANPAARRRTVAIFAIVLLVLAGLIAGALLTGSPKRVRVPSLRGLSRAAMSARLSRAHLRLTVQRRHSHAARNTEIGQRPAPGARASEGSAVLVTLSAGPPPVAVPRIEGFSTHDAESAVRQLGLHVRIQEVPAPGVPVGNVTGQHPTAGTELVPGATVTVLVAEAPRWRPVFTFTSQGGNDSSPFRIRGARWRLVYDMSFVGTCSFIFFCSGPTAHVLDLDRVTTVGSFGLSDGNGQVQSFQSGPGRYQVRISPGSDTTQWSAEVEDYY